MPPEVIYGKRSFALAGWQILTLLLSVFHEPWRDEAQAWLVATSSQSLGDLLIRSALEGTGIIYYILLWPFAQIFPAAFPGGIFILSWLGSVVAVTAILTWKRIPLWMGVLIAFGYLFGYEYPVVARLYGWGSAFLLIGIRSDLENRKLNSLATLSLACLTQLNFLFAVIGWIAYRSDSRKKFFSYWPVAIAAVVSVVHLQLYAPASPWSAWSLYPQYITRLGILLSAPFVHMHGAIGWGGLILFPLALLPLSKRARLALGVALTPYVVLFLFRYPGHPRTRHAGAIFILWIVLVVLDDWAKKRSSRYAVLFFLGVSFVIGLGSMVREVKEPFSHGLAAARAIESRLDTRPVRLYNSDPLYGTVVAARLNSPLWLDVGPRGCPFFTGSCPETLTVQKVPEAIINREQCGLKNSCYFVSHVSQPPFPPREGKWREIFRAEGSIVKEDIAVYGWAQD
jgi:hypothetical protein